MTAGEPVTSRGKLAVIPMARTSGSRNRDYDDKRVALLKRLDPRLSDFSQTRPSFREMAGAAGVSVPTLRHYFKDREGVVQAYLVWQGGESARYRPLVATTEDPFQHSIRQGASRRRRSGSRTWAGSARTSWG